MDSQLPRNWEFPFSLFLKLEEPWTPELYSFPCTLPQKPTSIIIPELRFIPTLAYYCSYVLVKGPISAPFEAGMTWDGGYRVEESGQMWSRTLRNRARSLFSLAKFLWPMMLMTAVASPVRCRGGNSSLGVGRLCFCASLLSCFAIWIE